MSTTVQDRVQIYCSDSWVERAVFQKDQKCSRAKLYRINDFPRLRRPEKDIYRDRYNAQQAELLKTLNKQVQQSIASIKRRRASEQQNGEIEIWIYVHGFRGNEHDLRYLKDFQQLQRIKSGQSTRILAIFCSEFYTEDTCLFNLGHNLSVEIRNKVRVQFGSDYDLQ